MDNDKEPEKIPWNEITKKDRSLRNIDLLKLSLRVFRTRFTRTMLTILGISLGVGIVLFLVSLGYGLQYTLIGRLVTTEDSLITIEAYYPPDSGFSIGQSELETIALEPSADGTSSVAEFPAEIKEVDSIVGETAPSGFVFAKIVENNYFELSGVVTDIGKTFTKGEEGVVISSAALKVLNAANDPSSFKKDFNIRILYADKEGNSQIVELFKAVKIIGVVNDDIQPPFIVVSKDLVTSPPPFYQRTLVKADNADVIEELRNKLINMGFLVSTHIDLVNQAQKVMNVITWILGIFGITALVVSAIGMFNTMVISFLERTFEVGIMKAIGATNGDIRDLFLMEALVIGVLGGFGGIFIGTFLGIISNFGLNILSHNFGGKEINLFVRPIWFQVVIVIFSGLIGLLSGFLPARRATKISPKDAFIRK